MKRKFPRFFLGKSWGDVHFVRINNEKDYGIFYFKNGDLEKLAGVNLYYCLFFKYKEIQEGEAVLML